MKYVNNHKQEARGKNMNAAKQLGDHIGWFYEPKKQLKPQNNDDHLHTIFLMTAIEDLLQVSEPLYQAVGTNAPDEFADELADYKACLKNVEDLFLMIKRQKEAENVSEA